jgi:TonB family protein
MRPLNITAALVVALLTTVIAQDKAKPDEYDVQRCTPKLVNRTKVRPPNLRKGEKVRNSPVITFRILESGAFTNVALKRSSGIADVDKYALASVRRFHYNDRPGCGEAESEAIVEINYRE